MLTTTPPFVWETRLLLLLRLHRLVEKFPSLETVIFEFSVLDLPSPMILGLKFHVFKLKHHLEYLFTIEIYIK